MQNKKKECYLLLDVGGTNIKGSALDADGDKICAYKEYPSKAKETKEVIFDNFYHILQDLKGEEEIAGIGFAFPGPFDYEHGISLIKGINKYDAIYGISFREEFGKRNAKYLETPMLFLHDVEAFALGCAHFGEARGAKQIMCLCIGTGAGSGFVKNGKVVKEPENGIPRNGWIYNTPFKDTIIDDYISVRGLHKLALEMMGEGLDGYELYQRCLKKDVAALAVYEAFGKLILEAIRPFIDSFHPDMLLLGGQISKSFSFFGKELTEYCMQKNTKIILEENTSKRAMQGLLAQLKER